MPRMSPDCKVTCVRTWTAGAVMLFFTSQAFSKITLVGNMISSINETAFLACFSKPDVNKETPQFMRYIPKSAL